jgi:hypothetical protein
LGLQEPVEVAVGDGHDDDVGSLVTSRISANENKRSAKEHLLQGTQEHKEISTESTSQNTPTFNFSSEQNRKLYGPWAEHPWTGEQLEFESALDQPTEIPRLLDQGAYKNDLMLWALLLDYRRQKDGSEAVIMFWESFRGRQVKIHKLTDFNGRLLGIFLKLGLKNPLILSQIVEFTVQRWISADSQNPEYISDRRSKRANGLYFRIIQHFLLHGCEGEAFRWHEVLSKHVSLQPKSFAEMCRGVAHNAGDLESLEKIYHHWKHYNIYSTIVPVLCLRKDHKSAIRWHFICLESGDLPTSSKDVEPLLQFLAVKSPPDARLVSQSLVEKGVTFASSPPSTPEGKAKLSREMMNMIHGETINVPAKAYNDPLGARWFATSWVSLDVAINAVHALGMEEIGPLSLQAIALRDPDPVSIGNRIKQLKELGISIGNSVFSKAVDKFSRNREREHLQRLLASDQHPDELEDPNLQENLLLAYAKAKDWAQYRLTLAIQALRSKHPTIEKKNIILRIHAARGDKSAIMETLADMNREGILVKAKSISAILRSILSHRSSSRRPVARKAMIASPMNELKLAVHVLKGLLMSGSYVPTSSWREILRRLGMCGYFYELESLSLFLAEWYGARRDIGFKAKFLVPVEVGTSSQINPLVNLFSGKFQKTIVEWGFVRGMKSLSSTVSPQPVPNVTSGITLLKLLHQRGIRIRIAAVRKAILNRLVAYYGPSRSNVRHNRLAREKLGIRNEAQAARSMAEMAEQIDEALGGRFFTAINLPLVIESLGKRRMLKVHRKQQRRLSQVPWGRAE